MYTRPTGQRGILPFPLARASGWWGLFAITLALTGCVADDTHLLVPSHNGEVARPVAPPPTVVRAPATEAAGQRVLSVAQSVIEANPKLGLRPLFHTLGVAQPELFHRTPAEGVVQGSQVYISEGLVQRCRNDGQLAALLCYELARMVAERESLAGPILRPRGDLPLEVPIGPDSNNPHGPPDNTRALELARAERDRKRLATRPTPPPDPFILARRYLVQTGFAPEVLEEVKPLLRQVEQEGTLEQRMNH
jgi:hypothetical protein